MPLEAVAIRRFDNTHYTINGVNDPELKMRIEKLYDNSPEFTSGAAAKGEVFLPNSSNKSPTLNAKKA